MTATDQLHQTDAIPDAWKRETAALVNDGKDYRLANLSDRIRAFLFFALKRHHTEELIDVMCLLPMVIAMIVAMVSFGDRMVRSLRRGCRRIRRSF